MVARRPCSCTPTTRSGAFLLKAIIVHRGGRIRRAREANTIKFAECVNKCVTDVQVQCLRSRMRSPCAPSTGGETQPSTTTPGPSRVAAVPGGPGTVTLFNDLLRRVFGESLSSHLPDRVLPVSRDPRRTSTSCSMTRSRGSRPSSRPGRGGFRRRRPRCVPWPSSRPRTTVGTLPRPRRVSVARSGGCAPARTGGRSSPGSRASASTPADGAHVQPAAHEERGHADPARRRGGRCAPRRTARQRLYFSQPRLDGPGPPPRLDHAAEARRRDRTPRSEGRRAVYKEFMVGKSRHCRYSRYALIGFDSNSRHSTSNSIWAARQAARRAPRRSLQPLA